MSVKSRTIDNLGLEASVQYAQNQKDYDPRLIEESRLIPQKAEVSTYKPYVPSELDAFFTIGKGASWALFMPPPDYFTSGKALFSYQLIPSLGTQEKQEADAEKLEHLEEYLAKQQKRGKKRQSKEGHEEEEEDREILIAMFKCLHKLDKTLTLINSRRTQYQRG